MSFDHNSFENKWRKKWSELGTYKVDLKRVEKKFYNLMMFPYPSAEGLHVGNMYAFTGADIYGRYKAMQGYDVFEPIGLDGFGIHSENYAIKIGKHPRVQAKVSEKRFYEQLEKIGNRFSWEQRLETYDPEYYKWTQWLFIKMYENGLAYRKKSLVNWCSSCKTVLADEQVEGGVCERCKTATEKKETYQWFFKITKYAQKLLDNIEKIDWPEKIKTAQRNWIGRSEGVFVEFKVMGIDKSIEVFTTAHDTIFGTTFMVLAPEHELVSEITAADKKKEVEEYVKKAIKKTQQQRMQEEKQKTGVFTGGYVINPFTNDQLPVWVADYVLMDYGRGAIMGVPGHDRRDWEFVKKHNLKMRVVIRPTKKSKDKANVKKDGFWDYSEIKMRFGKDSEVFDSGFISGLSSNKAKRKVEAEVEKRKIGKAAVQFKLRDWCISRQRYWGPPIPMIECNKCGWVAERLENLPVKLPDVKDFKPTGDGRSPLERASKDWLEVECPKCGGAAKRETDVSDTFLDSSWYFLRYPSVDKKDKVFDKTVVKDWLPVDAYIGGAEHAVLHLMYSRFVTMALKDWGYVDFEEPFPYLYSHGLIIKDGAKMSKSRGNVVVPDKYMDKFGVDALRMYLMFIGPYNQGGDFKDAGIAGMRRFLDRVWRVGERLGSKELERVSHKTVMTVTEAMGKLKYNVAIARLMEFVNELEKTKPSKEAFKVLVLMLAPFAPYVAEELWKKLGGEFSIHQQAWPGFDKDLVKEDMVEIVVQVNGRLRAMIKISSNESGEKEKVMKMVNEDANVKKWLKDKKIKKKIFVPGRLVNLVVS